MVIVFKNVWERSTAKNYRPVSFLSLVSKVFEKLLNNRIFDHLEKCGFFSDFQYDFRSSQSTADLLTLVSHRIAREFNRSGAIWAVVLDISKAFGGQKGAIDVKMAGSVFEEKSTFKMLGLTFSSKLDWGCYITPIAKTASKKIGALIRSMKFLSPETDLYLYKSTMQPFIGYCCHILARAPTCYLEFLDKLQKRICRTVGPSLVASLERLAHCQNVASLSYLHRYYFGRCSSELAQLVPLPYS